MDQESLLSRYFFWDYRLLNLVPAVEATQKYFCPTQCETLHSMRTSRSSERGGLELSTPGGLEDDCNYLLL